MMKIPVFVMDVNPIHVLWDDSLWIGVLVRFAGEVLPTRDFYSGLTILRNHYATQDGLCGSSLHNKPLVNSVIGIGM